MSSNTISKVLMVDDDPHIRLITQMSLEGLTKWQVQLAGSGNEALRLLEEERPDLVLLDMSMPGMDGTSVFTEMKRRLGTTIPQVIFMTAKVQSQEVEQYKTMGAAGVISKPFDPMTLPKQILEILGLDGLPQ
jgi:two-component system, OmpR family, response regulator